MNRDQYPELKEYQFTKMRDRYLSGVVNELARSVSHNTKHPLFNDDGCFPVSIESMKADMGRMKVSGKTVKVWDYVQKKTPLLSIIHPGNNIQKLLSVAKIIDKEAIMNALDLREIMDSVKEHKELEYNMPPVQIDIDGLKELRKLIARENTERSIRELIYIDMLLDVAPSGLLQQRGEFSDSNRLYLKGINLQSAPRRIRSVALGEHFLYDFSACAIGVFLSIFGQICKVQEVSNSEVATIHLRDYINRKTAYRVSVCRDVYGLTMPSEAIQKTPEYAKIKEAFTAIGFGARAVATSWNKNGINQSAIMRIFKYKDKADAFLNNIFAKNFIMELKNITDVIVDYYKAEYNKAIMDGYIATEFGEIVEGKPYKDDMKSKAKILAHIYQSHESILLNRLIEVAGDTLLLPLHDGIATSKPICNSELTNLKWEIMQDYEYVKLSKAEHKFGFGLKQEKPIAHTAPAIEYKANPYFFD